MAIAPDNKEETREDSLASSLSPSSADGDANCHMVPCNIDYTGMAPTHVFFKPVPIGDGIYASCFRGRGLLALNQNTSHSSQQREADAKPFLLSLEELGTIHYKASIESIVEWHHEHSPETLKFRDAPSRHQLAKEWIQVARSVSFHFSCMTVPCFFLAPYNDMRILEECPQSFVAFFHSIHNWNMVYC